MDTIEKLLKDYNQIEHEKYFKNKNNHLHNWKLKTIYSEDWATNYDKIPYESATHLIDSYYLIPERPDLAFGICWQAINNSYNELLIKSTSHSRLQDTKGLELLVENIEVNYSTKYKDLLDPYIDLIPDKLFNFISSYLLKGYVTQTAGFESKYNNSSYSTFVKKGNSALVEALKNTYFIKYNSLCSPCINSNRVEFNVKKTDEVIAHKIYRSLAHSLKCLIRDGNKDFYNKDTCKTYSVAFADKDKIFFLIFNLLYASRCNNTHGNVAARMNSIYSNSETYKSYMFIYCLAHMILGIAFNINGNITDIDLNQLKVNEKIFDSV